MIMARRKRKKVTVSLFAFQDIITATTGIMILLTLILSLSLVVAQARSPAVQTENVIVDLETALADVQGEIESLEGDLDYLEEAAGEVAGYTSGKLEKLLEEESKQVEHLNDESVDLAAKVGDAEKQNSEWDDRLKEQRRKRSELSVDRDKLREEQTQLERRLADAQEELRFLQQKLADTRASGRVVYNPRAGDGRIAWLVELRQDRILVARAGVVSKPVTFTGRFGIASEFIRWMKETRRSSKDFFVLFIAPDGIGVFDELMSDFSSSGFSYGTDLIKTGTTVVDPQKGGG
jgi:hypothetical protein